MPIIIPSSGAASEAYDIQDVANEAARLALADDSGQLVRQTDNGLLYIQIAVPASSASNWLEIETQDEVIENAGALAGAAPTGAKLGVDTTTGDLYYVAAGNWTAIVGGIQNNFAGVAPPTVTDDSAAGYVVGSRWLYESRRVMFTCIDATAGAAVWIANTKQTWAVETANADLTPDPNLGTEFRLLLSGDSAFAYAVNAPALASTDLAQEYVVTIDNNNSADVTITFDSAYRKVDTDGDSATLGAVVIPNGDSHTFVFRYNQLNGVPGDTYRLIADTFFGTEEPTIDSDPSADQEIIAAGGYTVAVADAGRILVHGNAAPANAITFIGSTLGDRAFYVYPTVDDARITVAFYSNKRFWAADGSLTSDIPGTGGTQVALEKGRLWKIAGSGGEVDIIPLHVYEPALEESVQTLVDAATVVDWDVALGRNAVFDVNGSSFTFNAPTNVVEGELYTLKLTGSFNHPQVVFNSTGYKGSNAANLGVKTVSLGDEIALAFLGGSSGELIAINERGSQGSLTTTVGPNADYTAQLNNYASNVVSFAGDGGSGLVMENEGVENYIRGPYSGQTVTLSFRNIGLVDHTVTFEGNWNDVDGSDMPDVVIPAGELFIYELRTDPESATSVRMERMFQGSSEAERTFETVLQATHGFTAGQPVYHTGAAWAAAQANNASTVAEGIVTNVIDGDNFEVTTHGLATVTGHGLTSGEYYWLDQTASAATDTQPTSGILQSLFKVVGTDQIRVDVGQAISASEGVVEEDHRVLLGTATGAVNNDNITISQTWGSLEADFEMVEFEMITTTGALILRQAERVPTAGWLDDTRVVLISDNFNTLLLRDMDIAGTTANWFESGTDVTDVTLNVYGLRPQKNVIPATAIVVDKTGLVDGDVLQYDAANDQMVRQAPTVVEGTLVTDTLDQTNINVSTSTSPAGGAMYFNPDFCHYVQLGKERHYNIRIYMDEDAPRTFFVNGAVDVYNIANTGYSLGSGDFANRMVFVTRTAANEITVNRDDDSNVDMFVDISFTAVMA